MPLVVYKGHPCVECGVSFVNMRHRDYKEFAAGESYHIYNRGNGRMNIFRDEQDYLNFLKRIRLILGKTRGTLVSDLQLQPLPADSFSLVAYCLMPNHFHLQITQLGDESVSKFMLKLATSYSMFFNRKYDHVGHVFQDQFKAVAIESDNQMAALSAYIHQNPKVAGLVSVIEKWPYSSYPEYIGIRNGDLSEPGSVLSQFGDRKEYRSFVGEQLEGIIEREEIRSLIVD